MDQPHGAADPGQGGAAQAAGGQNNAAAEATATFGDLYRAEVRHSRNDCEKRPYDDQVGKIKRAFERQHGCLQEYCFFPEIEAAVGLTEKGRLYVIDPPDASIDHLEALVMEAKGLHRNAYNLLTPTDLILCSEPLYGVVCGLFGAQETARSQKLGTEQTRLLLERSTRLHREEFKQAEQLIARCNRRRSQLVYFEGMLLGLAPLLLLALVVWVRLTGWFANPQIIIAWWVGGVGAVISVLQRMANGTLSLDPTADAMTLRVLGGVRPYVGSVFAAIVIAVILAEWSPLALTVGPALPFQVVAVAFIAGFSERWAQDMLAYVDRDALANPKAAPPHAGGGTNAPAHAGPLAAKAPQPAAPAEPQEEPAAVSPAPNGDEAGAEAAEEVEAAAGNGDPKGAGVAPH